MSHGHTPDRQGAPGHRSARRQLSVHETAAQVLLDFFRPNAGEEARTAATQAISDISEEAVRMATAMLLRSEASLANPIPAFRAAARKAQFQIDEQVKAAAREATPKLEQDEGPEPTPEEARRFSEFVGRLRQTWKGGANGQS